MSDLRTATLPVLPLSSGAVLPGMVVTIAVETDEARAAFEAAGEQEQILLVPRIEGRYSRIGVIAQIEDRGTLPNGTTALVVQAVQRAAMGAGVLGTGAALWVDAEPIEDGPGSPRAAELAREYRAAARNLLEKIGGRGMAGLLREVDTPGALADTIGWWPELSEPFVP